MLGRYHCLGKSKVWCNLRKLLVVDAVPYQPNSGPPKMLSGPSPMLIYKKKVFDVMLHLEAEWPSKQNILIADTILAEPGP